MDTPFPTRYAPSSPHSADSPTSHVAPADAASVTVPLESMQMPCAARRAEAQPGADEAEALRERIGPCVPCDEQARALDTRRIGTNALVSAIAQGGCFGMAFALNNYLRAHAPPVIKQIAGFLSPIVAGFLTSPAETAVRNKVGMQATALPEGASSGWHDAIPSVVLFSINKVYQKSRRLPKFAPGTPAGMGTTMALSLVGTGLAGALGEAAAQQAGGRHAQRPLNTRATIERGMARAATLVPMGGANLYAARHLVRQGQLPPNLGLKPLGIGVVGWAGRNKLGNWLSQRVAKTSQASPSSPQQAVRPNSPAPATIQGVPQPPSPPPSPGSKPPPTRSDALPPTSPR